MKVLIVRLSAIGDVIQGIPCLVALKESFPDWEISWLVEETSAPILEGHPCLARLFVLRSDWRKGGRRSPASFWAGLANMRAVARAIRREKFDAAIDLQGLFKSGFWTRLCGAPRRIGHDRTREFAHLFLNEYTGARPIFDPSFPLIERYLEPARHLGADLARAQYLLPPATAATKSQADVLLGSKSDRPLVAFCPWSAWPSKNWPLDRWGTLASILSKEARLVLLGTRADHAGAGGVFSASPHLLDLSGRTTLPVLAEILRRCQLVIGPDSGPVHLANATRRPKVLMLFGSTSRLRSGPWGKGHRSLALDLKCQPCFERLCPLEHFDCLRTLSVEQVAAAAREMLTIR